MVATSAGVVKALAVHPAGSADAAMEGAAVRSPALSARTAAAEKMAGFLASTSGFVGVLPYRNPCADGSRKGANCFVLTDNA